MATAERDVNGIDVEAIMARIRDEVREDLKHEKATPPPFHGMNLSSQSTKASPVIYSEELNYLNANWHNWAEVSEIGSHRRIVGPIIVRVKRLFVNIIWNSLLKGYFERERQFQMRLVKFLNETAKYIDARDAEIFWQIVQKIDNDMTMANERADRIFDEASATLRAVEQDFARRLGQLDELSGAISRNQGEIRELDTMLRGIERITALFGSQARPEREHGVSSEPLKPIDGVDYLLLENRYRGSEELITERIRDYVPLFTGLAAPVLDLGCGRGEFLILLKEAGVDAVGIDLNESMVTYCRQKGLQAIFQDALSYLDQLPDSSLGGVFAAQFVEHLTRDQLETLLELCVKKVKPGGKVAFETINPQSFVALASNFFRDPTHIWPLHAETMRFLFEMKGIKTDTVLMRSPFPEGAILQEVPISAHMPSRWRSTLQALNDNVKRLNRLLFGFQDYCIVGTVDEVAGRFKRSAAAVRRLVNTDSNGGQL